MKNVTLKYKQKLSSSLELGACTSLPYATSVTGVNFDLTYSVSTRTGVVCVVLVFVWSSSSTHILLFPFPPPPPPPSLPPAVKAQPPR